MLTRSSSAHHLLLHADAGAAGALLFMQCARVLGVRVHLRCPVVGVVLAAAPQRLLRLLHVALRPAGEKGANGMVGMRV